MIAAITGHLQNMLVAQHSSQGNTHLQ